MNAPPRPMPPDRLLDLLADRATDGLGEAEARELDTLLAECPGVDTRGLDLAAAAAYLAMAGPAVEPMPGPLRARVADAAAARLPHIARPPSRHEPLPAHDHGEPLPGAAWPAYAGWLAAAACIVIAAAAWWPGTSPSPAASRQRLMARAGVITAQWTEPATGAPASGDVVWDPATQTGYMRFDSCLPPNDPSAEVYQLWIFDATRDERYPVSGGIFSIPPGGEAVVPIRPSVPVRRATMFAVTVEQPGGVWVSDRSRLPLLAKAGG